MNRLICLQSTRYAIAVVLLGLLVASLAGTGLAAARPKPAAARDPVALPAAAPLGVVTTSPLPGPAAGTRPGTSPRVVTFAPVPSAATGGGVRRQLTIDGRQRQFMVSSPPGEARGRAPVLVVLHGRGMAPSDMAGASRIDALVPSAVRVYPIGVGQSWNAGACCGPARAAGVDDVKFILAVVHNVLSTVPAANPRAVYLIGYSNGGRMAYRVACQSPSTFAGLAIVEATPVTACSAGHAHLPLVIVGSTGDPFVRIDSGGPPRAINGFVEPSLREVATAWAGVDGCTLIPSSLRGGSLDQLTWSHCRGGARVALDVYSGRRHVWPPGSPGTPSATQAITAFFGLGPAAA